MGVASDVLELTSTVMNNKVPALYSDWIKVDRKFHSFSPEFFDQVCLIPMRAGLIEYTQR